jgi:ATP phosphoribosyltransferase regulatory subunit HisZ
LTGIYAFKIGHIGVIRGILTQDGIDEKTQNAVLQRMDKKEYDAALKLVESEKCRSMLKGLIEIKAKTGATQLSKSKTLLQTTRRLKEAADNLGEVLKLVILRARDITINC